MAILPATACAATADGLPVCWTSVDDCLGKTSCCLRARTPAMPRRAGRGAPAAAWMGLYRPGVWPWSCSSGEEPAGLLIARPLPGVAEWIGARSPVSRPPSNA